MLRATKNIMLPTTITGSLPRPSWYTQNLGSRSFLDAMVNNQFREQYVDAVSIYLHEQEMAGLDIVTDGDAHFDSDIGGQSWTNISGNLPDVPGDALVLSHGKLALGTDVGVFTARAGQGAGTFWRRLGSGLPHVVVDDLTAGPNGTVIAATHGRGVWQFHF